MWCETEAGAGLGRSIEETEALVVGVERCGGGKWADIKKLGFPIIAQRSAVDLKDKWRNLMRVALLPGTAAKCALPFFKGSCALDQVAFERLPRIVTTKTDASQPCFMQAYRNRSLLPREYPFLCMMCICWCGCWSPPVQWGLGVSWVEASLC